MEGQQPSAGTLQSRAAAVEALVGIAVAGVEREPTAGWLG
jgi:hypothetical protein